jgi:hypothetical protein
VQVATFSAGLLDDLMVAQQRCADDDSTVASIALVFKPDISG